MMKNISVASYVELLLAVFSIAGCENPTAPTCQPKDIGMTVEGDAPFYIEYSYVDALYGK